MAYLGQKNVKFPSQNDENSFKNIESLKNIESVLKTVSEIG